MIVNNVHNCIPLLVYLEVNILVDLNYKRENHSRSYLTGDAIKPGKSVLGRLSVYEFFFLLQRRLFRLLLQYDVVFIKIFNITVAIK